MPKHIGSSDCQQFGKGDDSVLGKQCASRGELFGSARTSRELVPSDRADTERLTEGRDLQQPRPAAAAAAPDRLPREHRSGIPYACRAVRSPRLPPLNGVLLQQGRGPEIDRTAVQAPVPVRRVEPEKLRAPCLGDGARSGESLRKSSIHIVARERARRNARLRQA